MLNEPLIDRRTLLRLAAAGAFISLAEQARAVRAAETAPPRASRARSHLETCLFNFRDGLASADIEARLSNLRRIARAPSSGGLLIRRNMLEKPFPTRFEWLYMLQFDGPAASPDHPTQVRFQRLKAVLSADFRNHVSCSLDCDLPERFADATGVKVRHTDMFNFKPETSAEARERNIAAIKRMGTLPMVSHYLVERSEAAHLGPDQMEWQVVGDFSSIGDYRAYSDSPLHLAIRDDFVASTSRVAFLDVEI